MELEELYDISFQLILHSGNARSSVMEAMYEARSGQFDKAEQKLNEANQELNKAHRFQTELIKKESGGDTYDIRIILVHAQDHLMNAMTLKDMAVEIIDLRREIKK